MGTCAFALVIGRSPIRAAGFSWTSRTLKASWAARAYHTTVIDAAGAIYVIGGFNSDTGNYDDVWVSTDGGADQTRRGYLTGLSGTRGVTPGYLWGTPWYSRGIDGVAARVPRDYLGVLRWCFRDTARTQEGETRGVR
jgi:hypothetical protein